MSTNLIQGCVPGSANARHRGVKAPTTPDRGWKFFKAGAVVDDLHVNSANSILTEDMLAHYAELMREVANDPVYNTITRNSLGSPTRYYTCHEGA